jgi:hypothetical protein
MINYSKKKGQESNWQFDSQPLKVRNHPDFLTCRWCATYCWKALDEGYNFDLNLTLIGGLQTKWWASKVAGSQFWEFRDSHLGFSRQNDIWVFVPWLGTKNIIRGKVVASFKFGPWWVLWVRVCPWFVYVGKVFELCTNQLFVWFVCVIGLLVIPLSLSWSYSTPLYPRSVMSQGACPTPYRFAVFTFRLVVESTKVFGGVSYN